MHKAVQLQSKNQRLYEDLEGLQFCAPEIFNKQIGHSMAVDEYAIGVLAYFLFSGMKDYPCKIPLYLTDDLDIYDHLGQAELKFEQPVWGQYRYGDQIKQLISSLLEFDDTQRLTASKALQCELFSPQTRLISALTDPILSNLEDLLYFNAFTA